MPQPASKSWLTILLLIALLSAPTVAAVQETAKPDETEETNETLATSNAAGLMLMDAFLLRPLGLAATVLGTVTFVATLPFSLPSRSVNDAANILVVKPATYTFARPLGQVVP